MLSNELFRMVALRGPLDGLTIDPSADIDNLQVVELLESFEVDPDHTSQQVIGQISNIDALDSADLDQLILADVAKVLDNVTQFVFKVLDLLQVATNTGPITLPELVRSVRFADAYRAVANSWIAIRLRLAGEMSEGQVPTDPRTVLAQHEKLIRAGHIGYRLVEKPSSLHAIGTAARLRNARVVLPVIWRDAAHMRRTTVHREGILTAPTPSRESAHAAAIRALVELKQRLDHIERIERVTHEVLLDLNRAQDSVDPLNLNNEFYTELNSRLKADERTVLTESFSENGTTRPRSLYRLVDGLDANSVILDANDACARIRVFEEAELEELPGARQPSPGERAAVRAIGWGDLIVAHERLVGYEAREIAHIENVLSGEKKSREHERTHRTETIAETEAFEFERD